MIVQRILSVVGAVILLVLLIEVWPLLADVVSTLLKVIKLVITRVLELASVEFHGPNADWFNFALRFAFFVAFVIFVRQIIGAIMRR